MRDIFCMFERYIRIKLYRNHIYWIKMVGKIKRIRQKLHHGAVKLENEHENRPRLGNLEKIAIQSIQLTKTDSKQPKTNTSDSSINNNSKVWSFVCFISLSYAIKLLQISVISPQMTCSKLDNYSTSCSM